MTAKVLHYLNATLSQAGLKFVFLFEKLLLNLQINCYLLNYVFSFSAWMFKSKFHCHRVEIRRSFPFYSSLIGMLLTANSLGGFMVGLGRKCDMLSPHVP